jgi:FkbM family methyltransferase
MIFIKAINSILNKLGVEIKRYPTGDLSRRMKMLNNHKIDLIIDVGANKGEYTSELIDLGYSGRIESFEPLCEVYNELNTISKKHNTWSTHKIALGDFDGKTEINVAGNINSSSLLEMLPRHEKSAPTSKYTKKETIHVQKLDSILNSIVSDNQNIFIKIDVQGYEMAVLKGAENSLDKIKGIQIEMSLEPLYQGSMLYREMIEFLESKGFELYSIENGFSDPITGKLLQIDGIFFRS